MAAIDISSLYSKYPLNESKRELRILEIVSPQSTSRAPWKRNSTEIKVRFHVVCLLDKPEYSALSYVWGDPNDTEPIQVLHGFGRYAKIQITKNLARALRIVKGHYMKLDEAHKNLDPDGDLKEQDRKVGQGFRIWADALCINQNSDTERGQQVALMKHIYTQAEIVFASLSPCEGFTDEAIELALQGLEKFAPELAEDYKTADSTNEAGHLGQLGWLERVLEETLSKADTDSPWYSHSSRAGFRVPVTSSLWDAISGLPEIDYFKRVWVRQEICLANELYFMHKEQSVPWLALAGAYKLLNLAADYLRDRDSLATGDTESEFARTSRSREKYLVEKYGEIVEHIIAYLAQGSSHDFEYLIDWNHRSTQGIAFTTETRCGLGISARSLSATNPKDYVYGLLGLTGYDIVPDYSNETALGQVNAQFLSCWIEDCESETQDSTNHHLVPLAYAGLHFSSADSDQTPTWAPTFHNLEEKYIFMPSLRLKDSISSMLKEAENPSICLQDLELSVSGAEIDEVYAVFPETLAKMVESRTLISTYVFYQGELIQDQSSQGQLRFPLLPMKTLFQISTGRIVDDRSPEFLGLSTSWLLQLGLMVSSQGTQTLDANKKDWRPLDHNEGPELLLGRYNDMFGSHIHDADRLTQNLVLADTIPEQLSIISNVFTTMQLVDVILAVEKRGDSRRLFLTKRGILGIGSVCTIPGDKVVSFKHTNVPSMIRRVSAVNEEKWKLVGGCFIPQLEAGEIDVEDIGVARRFVLV